LFILLLYYYLHYHLYYYLHYYYYCIIYINKIIGARTELKAKNISVARKLILRSLSEAPMKKRAHVLLEWSRIEEYIGDIQKSRNILRRAKEEAKHEWKVIINLN
jgi:hypothetical protein